MASFALIEGETNRLPEDQRAALQSAFREVCTQFRFGRAEDGEKSENFGAAFFEGETPAVAGTEFSIPHSFGRAPYLLIPVLPLDAVGAQIVPLEVTKAADSKRVYLKSTAESAPVFVYVEG